MSVQGYVNPLNRGFVHPARHTGARRATTTLPPAPCDSFGRFLRSTPNRIDPLTYGDMLTGQINQPRLAPHRRGLQPRKSCMKHPKPRPRSSGKSVRFTVPADCPVTCRCLITRQEFFPIGGKARQREVKDFTTPIDARCAWAPSPCDEPMTGVSPPADAEAMQYRQEEMALDEQHVLAATNAAKNKLLTAPGLPNWFIPTKFDNYLHPCLEGKPRKERKSRRPS